MKELLDMTAEEIVALLSQKPELQLRVSEIIGRRLATAWDGGQKFTRLLGDCRHKGYQRTHLAAVQYNKRFHAMAEPAWSWWVPYPEERGWARSKEEALAACDRRLIERGYTLVPPVYHNDLQRLAEVAEEK